MMAKIFQALSAGTILTNSNPAMRTYNFHVEIIITNIHTDHVIGPIGREHREMKWQKSHINARCSNLLRCLSHPAQ